MSDPAALLVRALEMAVSGDVSDIEEVFTEDVLGWSPTLAVSTRDELAEVLAEREDSFSDAVVAVNASVLGPDRAVAEGVVSAVHTGTVLLDDDTTIEAFNTPLVLAGATFAEYRDGRISTFRHYFDDAALLEQMLTPLVTGAAE